MQRKTRRSDKQDIPMSAMIDIVFLLLIFFIWTHKEEIVEAHMAINLPSPDIPSGPPPPKPRLLEIQIPPDSTHEGIYFLLGSPKSLDVLEGILAKQAALDAEQTVVIKVSQEARQGKLIELLDRCKKVGLSKLNVLTLKK
jgi:biopolymer transport protein ExbD